MTDFHQWADIVTGEIATALKAVSRDEVAEFQREIYPLLVEEGLR